MSLNTAIKFDFSKDSDHVAIPGQEYIDQFGSAMGLGENLLKQYKLSQILPFIFGKVASFEPKINDLKVYQGETELFDEAEQLNKAIS